MSDAAIWLGKEGISFYREQDLKEVLRRHMLAEESEIGRGEAIGALNFLTIDDLPIGSEGAEVDPTSIVSLPVRDGVPVFPAVSGEPDDPFLRRVEASGRPWVVITDEAGEPVVVLDADGFLRDAVFRSGRTDPAAFCHAPVVIRDPETTLGAAIEMLRFDPSEPDLIHRDTILLWNSAPRVITGADLLGRLLRGVVRHAAKEAPDPGTAPSGARKA